MISVNDSPLESPMERELITLAQRQCPFLARSSKSLLSTLSESKEAFKAAASKCPRLKEFSKETLIRDAERVVTFSYMDCFSQKIKEKKQDGSYRTFNNISRLAKEYPLASNQGSKRRVTVWCANDYLGMSRHPRVVDAMKKAADEFGTGAGGTRNIAGTSDLHVSLEKSLAQLHSKESALVFSSCFVANDATISTLIQMMPGCHVFSDERNHASMILGIRNSRIPKEKRHIFKHNDTNHLEELLSTIPKDVPKLILFESVYSMCGSIGPIKRICSLAKKYNALTFLDEVHAVGMYGKTGSGVAEMVLDSNELKQIDIVTGTLGKAFGVVGGYIAASNLIVDLVRSYAPGFIFTTSLPPPVVAAALESVEYLKNSDRERSLQQLHARMLKSMLGTNEIPVLPNPSHIVPVMVGDATKCKIVSDLLLQDYGIYVQPINYPTVPVGQERLRITPSPWHTSDYMKYFSESLVQLWNDLKLPKVKEWLNTNLFQNCNDEHIVPETQLQLTLNEVNILRKSECNACFMKNNGRCFKQQCFMRELMV